MKKKCYKEIITPNDFNSIKKRKSDRHFSPKGLQSLRKRIISCGKKLIHILNFYVDMEEDC